eukprot:g3082.t1
MNSTLFVEVKAASLFRGSGLTRASRTVSRRRNCPLRSRVVPVRPLRAVGDAKSEDVSSSKSSSSFFTVFTDPVCNRKLFALAAGQMLCSIATLIHDTYLPVYMQDVLQLTNTKIGAVQGVAQFLAQLAKGVSGVVGDILGSQIRVVLFGIFLTLLCKPIFALSGIVASTYGVTVTLYLIVFGKLMDRLSKGVREAPTKAVMNELAQKSGDSPDAAYGMRFSLATTGALIGSGLAAAVFSLTGQNFILTFTAAAVPPAFALLWVFGNFKDDLAQTKAAKAAKNRTQESHEEEIQLSLWQKAQAIAKSFQPAYWQALIVIIVLYFARFDASFLLLRAKQVMPKTELATLALVQMSVQAVLTAPLSKAAGTSVARRNLMLSLGFILMICADAVFGLPQFAHRWGMWLGACILALHMAMTHSITLSMIGSYMPTGNVPGVGKLSGTAWSVTDFILGFALVASNGLAGVLSDMTAAKGLGNVGCFAGGAFACIISIVLLNVFAKFGSLGKDELVMTKRRKK